MSEQNHPFASRQSGCADFEAIPSSSGQTLRSEGRWEDGNQGVVAQEELGSREGEVEKMEEVVVEEQLPSLEAVEVVAATLWRYGSIDFTLVVKLAMLMAGLTPSRA